MSVLLGFFIGFIIVLIVAVALLFTRVSKLTKATIMNYKRFRRWQKITIELDGRLSKLENPADGCDTQVTIVEETNKGEDTDG
ncbi:hypothetical protein LCGC14_1204890 [marine sediment metagenome]|uniref:Uncharacterized protein n=1 Tax=marine sediment metagenome TaxID=412755 RepID=A0A0F9M387_9ZZZZ